MKISRPSPGESIKILLFIDLTGRAEEINKIVNEARSFEFVERVDYEEPIFRGFAAFSKFLPLTMFGHRAIILKRPFYEAMIKH